jgi:hypothetical protein
MKIGRPRQLYDGDINNKFVPIDEREDKKTKFKVPKKSDYFNIPIL